MPNTYIDLLRHGQVQTPGLFCAPSPEPLSTVGWQQLEHATRHCRPDWLISSPSVRCHAFAETFSCQNAIPLQVEPRLQEMNFGQWVGRQASELWQTEQAQMECLWNQPLDFTAPAGEAMPTFIQRVQSAWADLLQQHAGQRLLVLTHAGVIRVLLAQALGIPYPQTLRFELAYAHFVRITVYADGTSSVYGLGLEQLPC